MYHYVTVVCVCDMYFSRAFLPHHAHFYAKRFLLFLLHFAFCFYHVLSVYIGILFLLPVIDFYFLYLSNRLYIPTT